MDIAYRICKYIVLFAAFIIAVLYGPNILPPDAKFTSFKVTPVKHDGNYAEVLHKVERLFEEEIKGPESFEVVNDVIYTTLHGGYVAKVLKDVVIPLVKFGRSCEGWWEESICGRPLGLKAFEDRYLIIADAYYGIFQYDTKTGQVLKLIDKETTINGKKPKIFNSVEITKDGTIYWTHSSSDFHLEDGILAFLTDGSGRLIKFDRKSRTNTVLMEGLYFANGLVLSTEEDYLLVAESGHSRIHRYYLKGPKRGTSEIFIDGLPGIPDNLRRGSESDFLVPLVCSRSEDYPALFQVVAPFPTLRKFFVRLIAYIEFALEEILKINSNYPTQRLVHYLGHLESVSSFFPPNVTLLVIDDQGKIIKSYLGIDRSIASVSDVLPYNGYLYFGSPFNAYLGRLKLSALRGVPEETVTIPPEIYESDTESTPPPETDESDTETTFPPETTTTTTSSPPPTTTTTTPPKTTKPPPSTTRPPPPTTRPPPPTTTAKPPPPSTTSSPPPTTTTKPPPSPTTTTKPSPPPTTRPPPPTTTAKPPPPSTTRSPPPTTTTKPPPSPTTTTKPSPPPTTRPPPPTTTTKPPPPSTTAPPKSTKPPMTTTTTTTSRPPPPPSTTQTTAVKSDPTPTPVIAAPKNAQPTPNTREEESLKKPQPSS